MRFERVFPVFSVVFGVCYLISMYFHPVFTLFTYAPRLGQWFWGAPALGAQGPGMFWWSWLFTGFLGGLVAALVATILPETVRARTWPGFVWATPVALTIALLWIERTWFGFK